MPQRHLDRLSSLDAGFLHQEDGGAHMHIGALATFAGPVPSAAELAAHLSQRLALVPRFRQKLAFPPLGSGRPLWVDDPSFNLGYHLRRTALPSPGGEGELLRLTARVLSQRLDRTKPLWELWVVEGLADGRFAVLTKTHHALVDGVGGIDIATALLDVDPGGRSVEDDSWAPRPRPSAVELLAAGATGAAGAARDLAGGLAGGVRRPLRTAFGLAERAAGLGEITNVFLRPAARTSLNVPPGPHREVAVVRADLAELKEVKDTFGGTVNDVVLAAVAGALGRFLAERGERLRGARFRAGVPVSIRGDPEEGAEPGALGNRLTVLAADLPVDVADPVARLRAVTWTTQRLKRSRLGVGVRTLTRMEEFAPPTVLAQASRLGFSSRAYNLLVTNVPGPPFPVWLLGREMLEIVPLAFLAPEHTLAVAVLSYRGALAFGLLADPDAVPDLPRLAGELEAELGGLRAAAAAAREHAPRAVG